MYLLYYKINPRTRRMGIHGDPTRARMRTWCEHREKFRNTPHGDPACVHRDLACVHACMGPCVLPCVEVRFVRACIHGDPVRARMGTRCVCTHGDLVRARMGIHHACVGDLVPACVGSSVRGGDPVRVWGDLACACMRGGPACAWGSSRHR